MSDTSENRRPTERTLLTRLRIRRFKRFEDAEMELGPVTVLVGPNNLGKSSALQALGLWRAGLAQWLLKRGRESKARDRPGVAINRRATPPRA